MIETASRNLGPVGGTDAVKHPAAPDLHAHRHPRAGDALVTLFKDAPALAGPRGYAAAVMPERRAFH